MWALLPACAANINYSPKHTQQEPSELSFFPGHLQVWGFFPHTSQEGSCREQTGTVHKCFTPLTCSPAKLWSCTDRALICLLYLSNPNTPHTTQKSFCRALHLQSGGSCAWPKLLLLQHVLANQSGLAFHC